MGFLRNLFAKGSVAACDRDFGALVNNELRRLADPNLSLSGEEVSKIASRMAQKWKSLEKKYGAEGRDAQRMFIQMCGEMLDEYRAVKIWPNIMSFVALLHSEKRYPEVEELWERVRARAEKAKEGVSRPGDLVQAYSGTRNVADKVRRVSALLSRGVDPNVREQRGHPLLHMAVNDGHLEVVKLLLEHGADVNATNPTGSTALHIAASWDDGEMVELLLGYEPDVNIRNNAGRTPLDSAELAGPPTETADGRPMRGGVEQLLRRHGGRKGSELSLGP